jgi:glycosyltransferase involved in cell wall biosynthesis
MKSSRGPDSVLVSVLIPAFNEEQAVGMVVERASKVLEELGLTYEVIVVDDGSNDGTASLSERSGARVIGNGCRMGKGVALKTGFHACRGDVIVTLDGDGAHRPEEIPRLLKPIINGGFDLSIGLRVFSSERSATIKFRMLGNSIFSYFISMFAGRKVVDSQCGFRAFRADLVRGMELSSKRFEIESEMLVNAIRNGCRFIEVPITVSDGLSHSKVNVFADGLIIFSKTLLNVIFSYGK